MLHNADYNAIKLLHDICTLHWFIEKHAIDDAKRAEQNEMVALLQDMSTMLATYEQTLHRIMQQKND
jgi:hypothetical protein